MTVRRDPLGGTVRSAVFRYLAAADERIDKNWGFDFMQTIGACFRIKVTITQVI